jgi:DNA-binding NtrC family response regulator
VGKIMANILVIDDEEMMRFTVSTALEIAGHNVILAENGKVADEIIEKNPFDLVITDILMPEKEGLQTILGIKTGLPDMKIIAMSGGGRTGALNFLSDAVTFGADAILRKPFSDSDLLCCVDNCLAETSTND